MSEFRTPADAVARVSTSPDAMIEMAYSFAGRGVADRGRTVIIHQPEFRAWVKDFIGKDVDNAFMRKFIGPRVNIIVAATNSFTFLVSVAWFEKKLRVRDEIRIR